MECVPLANIFCKDTDPAMSSQQQWQLTEAWVLPLLFLRALFLQLSPPVVSDNRCYQKRLLLSVTDIPKSSTIEAL